MRYDELEVVSDDEPSELEVVDDSGSPRKLSFLGFWNMLVLRPKEFFEHHFQKRQSPYLFLVVFVVGVARAIDKMETEFVKFGMGPAGLALLPQANSWIAYWVSAVMWGIVYGAVSYCLGGWWYDVRVGWAGGIRDRESSRFLYLYASFIPGVLQVMAMLGNTLEDKRPFPHELEGVGQILVFGTLVLATFYATYVSYRGVRTVMDAPRWGARLWFFIIPGLFYTLVLGGAMATMLLVGKAVPAGG